MNCDDPQEERQKLRHGLAEDRQPQSVAPEKMAEARKYVSFVLFFLPVTSHNTHYEPHAEWETFFLLKRKKMEKNS